MSGALGGWTWTGFRIHLIQSEFSAHGERAYGTLVAAARAVGFRYLKEVLSLEEEIASEADYPSLLREHSIRIAD